MGQHGIPPRMPFQEPNVCEAVASLINSVYKKKKRKKKHISIFICCPDFAFNTLPHLSVLCCHKDCLMLAVSFYYAFSFFFFTKQMPQPAEQADNDFLNALLSGSDSVSASPLWSPSPSDSGISEDPQSDQMDSPQRPESPPDAHFFGAGLQAKAALEANVSSDPSNFWIHVDMFYTICLVFLSIFVSETPLNSRRISSINEFPLTDS